jgi:heme exporter protein D
MTGQIVGGIEFVWAAYAVSSLVFLGYTLSVVLRYREAIRRDRIARDERTK